MEDNEILGIRGPGGRTGGPHVVVYKGTAEPFAVVALNWYGEPALGIRWFDDEGNGFPVSRGAPVWFLFPAVLHEPVLTGLRDLGEAFGLSETRRSALKAFLRKDITGEELSQIW